MLYFFPLSFLFLAAYLFDFTAPPWISFHKEIFLFIFLFVFLLISIFKEKYFIFNKNQLNASLLLLITLLIIQTLCGFYYKPSVTYIPILYMFFCMLSMSITNCKSIIKNWSLFLSINIVIASSISSLICIAQSLNIWNDFFFIAKYDEYRRPGANLGQANHLATLILMGILSLIYISQKFSLNKFLIAFISLLFLLGASITESRTFLLATTFLAFFYFYLASKFQLKRITYFIITAHLLVFFMMPMWPKIIEIFHNPTSSNALPELNTTSSMRLEMWRQLFEAIWIKPWFGWGVHGVTKALNQVQSNYLTSSPFTYSHNIFIDICITFGVPIAIIVSTSFSLWFFKKIKEIKNIEQWYAIAILIAFLTHSLLEYPFAYTYFLFPVMIAIGTLESTNQLKINKNIILPIFFIVSFICLILVKDYFFIEKKYSEIMFSNLNFQTNHSSNQSTLLKHLDILNHSNKKIKKNNLLNENLEDFEFSALFVPRYIPQLNYILLLKYNDRNEEVCKQLSIFKKIHKGNSTDAHLGEYFSEDICSD